MARRSEFYKGRRKKRNYAIIPRVILLLIFSVGIVLFYSTQKYAVVSDDGVAVELPLLSSGEAAYNEEGNESKIFEPVSVNIQFEEENIFAGAELHIVLPEGFSFVMDESGDATDIRAVRGD